MEISGIFATQILREFNFGHLKPRKTAILTNCAAPHFDFLVTFDILSKYEIFLEITIQSIQNCKKVVFDTLKSAKFDFT